MPLDGASTRTREPASCGMIDVTSTGPHELRRWNGCHVTGRDRLRRALVQVLRRRLGGLQDAVGDQAGVLADRGLDLVGDGWIVWPEALGVLAGLAAALAVGGEPGARLLHDAGLHAEVDQLADLRDALAEHDVELDLL